MIRNDPQAALHRLGGHHTRRDSSLLRLLHYHSRFETREPPMFRRLLKSGYSVLKVQEQLHWLLWRIFLWILHIIFKTPSRKDGTIMIEASISTLFHEATVMTEISGTTMRESSSLFAHTDGNWPTVMACHPSGWVLLQVVVAVRDSVAYFPVLFLHQQHLERDCDHSVELLMWSKMYFTYSVYVFIFRLAYILV